MRKNCQRTESGGSSPLLGTSEATPESTPAVGSLAEKRHEHIGENPVKGHKDLKGTGGSLL